MHLIPNILKVALRNIRRKPGYALINITGLAVGLACSILVLLYVYDEYSYDRYHENADRIFRLDVDVHTPSETSKMAVSSGAMGPNLAWDFPDIVAMTRRSGGGGRFQYEDKVFSEVEEQSADSSFFKVFRYEFLRGNPETALAGPYKAVLTESLARKMFGEEDPVGKTIRELSYNEEAIEYTVSGVVEDVPRNSHFTFDILTSMETWHSESGWDHGLEWFTTNYDTYLLLSESAAADPASLEAQFPEFLSRHIGDEMKKRGKEFELSLRPLTEIHLYSDRLGEYNPAEASTVYIFAVVGFLILLIACVNFMNLATVRSMERAREVGIRKTLGGDRLQLAGQFLGEAILTGMAALAIAYVLCIQMLPLFNQFSGKEIGYEYLYSGSFILSFLAIGLGVGLFSGIYPALVLSRFRPADVLRGSDRGSVGGWSGGRLLRKGLVVFQFTLSMLLITGTIVIRNQVDYLQNIDPGFDREQMMILNFGDNVAEKFRTVKQEFLRHPAVEKAALSGRIPGEQANRHMTTFYRKDGKPKKSFMKIYLVGYDFVDTYDIQLIAGRNFSKSFTPDSTLRYIINRSALPNFGIDKNRPEEAVGLRMRQFNMDGTVVGVAEDFHFRSLHHEIDPISLVVYPWAASHLALKVKSAGLSDTIEELSGIWERFAPDQEFDYIFLDEYLKLYYESERKFSRVAFTFTLLAIFIACLGLLGLTGYNVSMRSKEISVRKVLGATAPDILFLLIRHYLYLIGIAVLIALPVSWYLLQTWLQNFAYHAPVGIEPFLISAAGLLGITLSVISWLTTRAALRNPVHSLRTE